MTAAELRTCATEAVSRDAELRQARRNKKAIRWPRPRDAEGQQRGAAGRGERGGWSGVGASDGRSGARGGDGGEGEAASAGDGAETGRSGGGAEPRVYFRVEDFVADSLPHTRRCARRVPASVPHTLPAPLPPLDRRPRIRACSHRRGRRVEGRAAELAHCSPLQRQGECGVSKAWARVRAARSSTGRALRVAGRSEPRAEGGGGHLRPGCCATPLRLCGAAPLPSQAFAGVSCAVQCEAASPAPSTRRNTATGHAAAACRDAEPRSRRLRPAGPCAGSAMGDAGDTGQAAATRTLRGPLAALSGA